MMVMDGKHRKRYSEGEQNIVSKARRVRTSKHPGEGDQQMIGWKHTKMSEGGRGEKTAHIEIGFNRSGR